MDYALLLPLLDRIRGATFATMDTETFCGSGKSVRKVVKNERVIIFRTKGGSGYEGMVKRRLEEAGKNPDLFVVGALPWGERIDDLPLITNDGKYYLQTIQLSPGEIEYFIGTTDIPLAKNQLDVFGIRQRYSASQGLPKEEQVVVNTHNIDNIHRIVLMGEEIFETAVVSKSSRDILKIKT